jgi:hypothetical protein
LLYMTGHSASEFLFEEKRYAIWGRLVAAQPDKIACIIFASSVVTSFMPTLFPLIACEYCQQV